MAAGQIETVPGLKAVAGDRLIELDDGSKIEVDTIIWCTGYHQEFKLLDASVDPCRNTTPKWAASIGSRGKPLPRLYKNIFSLDFPDSLAFMGCVAFATSSFPLYDIASMALAQIWNGNSPLPEQAEMERAVDKQHAWVCETARTGSAVPGWVKQGEWVAWANEAAGTGLNEKLGWGIQG